MLRIESRNLHSWKSLFRTTRAPVSILFAVGLALVLPEQTSDELLALSTLKIGPVPGLFILQFALGSIAISAWYWSRAALAARFGVDDAREARDSMDQTHRRAFDAVPRVLFVAGVGLSLFLIWRGPSWANALSVAAWSIPAYMIIRWRLAVTTPRYRSAFVNLAELRSRRHLRNWVRVIYPRLRALMMLAPFGPWVATPLLGLGMVVFVWGSIEGFLRWGDGYPGLPALAARVFPGPSVALIGSALMMGPLTALIFVMDGLRLETMFIGRQVGLSRPPVITGLLVWSLIAPLIFSLHSVRVLEPDAATVTVKGRASLGQMFNTWATACAPDPALPARPIVVAISGGGSRAGIWGAQVLAAVDAATGQRNSAVFAVSSVSGGSLGAAAYMAVMKGTGAQCVRPADAPSVVRQYLNRLNNEELGADALGPLLAGTLLSDTPRSMLSPIAAAIRLAAGTQPRGGDRAEALERAFEGLWREDLLQAHLLKSGIPEFSDSFLSLNYQQGHMRPGMPIWIVNGTDLTTGDRMLTAPFGSAKDMEWPFRATGDVLGVLDADVAISTAINNGARFPYLEPAGELISIASGPDQIRRGRPEILDGGYFDNEGLQTAMELADWLRRLSWHGRAVEPVIVQATADADIDAAVDGLVVRCPNRPLDVPTELPHSSYTLQLLMPLVGLYNVRLAHSAVLLREARDRYCAAGQQRSFFHFYLFSERDRDIPLNWLLSPAIVAAIRSQLSAGSMGGSGGHNGNDTEYDSFYDTLHGVVTASDP